jgi:phage terminase small subunit
MNPPTDPLNPRERAFVDAYIVSGQATDAYRKAGYAATTARAANVGAHKILHRPRVAAAIAAERAALRAASRMTKEDAIDWLCDAIRTPIGEIDEKNQLAQEWTVEEVGELTTKTKLKMVPKLESLKQLALMLGWNAPEEVNTHHQVTIVIGGDAE